MRLTVLLLCLVWTASAAAGELLVRGEVVRVDSITERHLRSEQVGDCAPVRPAANAGLIEVLRWDLRADCGTREVAEEVISGYRVHYQWDDRRWQTVMDEHPGETIALRVQVD